MKLANTFLFMAVGAAIIGIALLIPASKVIRIIFMVLGGALILLNAINLLSQQAKNKMDKIFSALGILLGVLMIIFPNGIISIIVAIYFIAMPLINRYYYHQPFRKNEALKICLGVIFLLFAPLSVSLFDQIVKVALIVVGALIILGAFVSLFVDENGKLKIKNNKAIDYDFSDKNK